MVHTRFIKDILEDIISEMNFDIDVKTVVDNADGTFDLTVCDVKHLQIGFLQTIDSESYTISDINYITKVVTVTGTVEPPTGIFEAHNPQFYHGTIIQTNNELSRIVNVSDKTPMIYLYESFDESFNLQKDMAIERVSDVKIFFLTQANFEDWVTEDYYDNALTSMRYLLDNFLYTLDRNSEIGRIETYTARNHTKFGLFVTDKGYELNYFNDQLAGIELNISLPIKRDECELGC